jgi:hypothetical protein
LSWGRAPCEVRDGLDGDACSCIPQPLHVPRVRRVDDSTKALGHGCNKRVRGADYVDPRRRVDTLACCLPSGFAQEVACSPAVSGRVRLAFELGKDVIYRTEGCRALARFHDHHRWDDEHPPELGESSNETPRSQDIALGRAVVADRAAPPLDRYLSRPSLRVRRPSRRVPRCGPLP